MITILIDIDGVVANFEQGLLNEIPDKIKKDKNLTDTFLINKDIIEKNRKSTNIFINRTTKNYKKDINDIHNKYVCQNN